MAQPYHPGIGAALYRIAFVLFIIGCAINAYDAYTTYVQAENLLIHGVDPADKLNETIAFCGLTVLLTLEGVCLIMYKWTRRQVSKII